MPSSAPTPPSPLPLHDALPICGCFGEFSSTPITGRTLTRSILLAAAALGTVNVAPIKRTALNVPQIEMVLIILAIELAIIAALSDRKSTRLNSSHLGISYAVFCSHPALPSSPTRRASDLRLLRGVQLDPDHRPDADPLHPAGRRSARYRQRRPDQADCVERPSNRDGFDHPGDRARHHRGVVRSEEHTSELQSLRHLVCRLLLPPRPPLFPYTTRFRSAAASGSSARPRSPAGR